MSVGSGSGGQAKEAEDLLEVHDLCVSFINRKRVAPVVRDVNFAVRRGEVLGIVGESGSGKSVTVKAVMGILRRSPGVAVSGSVRLNGHEILGLDAKRLRQIQGREMSMIFQDPMTALDPLMRIGAQLTETLHAHMDISTDDAWRRAVDLLRDVEIPDPERRARNYPHELSGGMRQRVMIAIAIACSPALVIADEPTTALDVTTQANVLALINKLRRENGSSVVFVTHDLAVLAQLADRVMVMYSGRCLEEGAADTILHSPQHPYTIALLAASPATTKAGERLLAIEGTPPAPTEMPRGCVFAARCGFATARCSEEEPPIVSDELDHSVRCWYSDEVAHKIRDGGSHAAESIGSSTK